MVMKKVMHSNAMIIIGDSDQGKKFPPGFSYVLGGVVYTVRENATKDATSQMRKVITSEGATEILSIETILKDVKEHDCQILEEGSWPEEKKAETELLKKETPENGK